MIVLMFFMSNRNDFSLHLGRSQNKPAIFTGHVECTPLGNPGILVELRQHSSTFLSFP